MKLRPATRLAFALLLSLVALGVFAGPAFAHNDEISSTPAAGAVVTTQPDVIAVTTSDKLLAVDGLNGGMGIQVSGPAEHPLYYGDGCVSVNDATIQTKAALGQPGEYTVSWQVVSADGHSVSDSFTFTWKPDSSQQPATGAATPPSCGTAAGATTEAPATAAPGGDAAITGGSTASRADTSAALTDVVWIGGAVLVVVIAVVVTLIVVRRQAAVPRE